MRIDAKITKKREKMNYFFKKFYPTIAFVYGYNHTGIREWVYCLEIYHYLINLQIRNYQYGHFLKQLIDNIKNGLKPDILLLLMATKIKYEDFAGAAIKSIWCPANSVDAERLANIIQL